MTTRREIIAFIGALPILSLAGCGQGDTAANCQPIVLGDARACALCGMTINNFPGPRARPVSAVMKPWGSAPRTTCFHGPGNQTPSHGSRRFTSMT